MDLPYGRMHYKGRSINGEEPWVYGARGRWWSRSVASAAARAAATDGDAALGSGPA